MKHELAAKQIDFVSLNAIDGGPGQERHAEAGGPTIPCLLLDGEPFSFQHPSQIASIVGLEVEGGQPATGVAWSLLDVLMRWLDVIADVPFEGLRTPTPSRERDIRNLTVNVFRPIRYLPETWRNGEFHWYTGEADLQQEAFLRTTGEVHAFAQEIAFEFNGFLLDHGDELSERDPQLTGNRGEMPYSALLQTQRFHAAFHYRQIVDHLAGTGVKDAEQLPEAVVREIALPPNLY